ncbi:GNAT family N-acetyltransferase [Kitasatospora sp. NPDC048540]|uniref:GNAT family N-acetyltransferase n=1 Tax=unclassified Kitasatospora TaxID=2633591 RepID=UPI00068C959D|nr:GNAT family N-acetyltransferase [Kitasatospora sp. MBT63]
MTPEISRVSEATDELVTALRQLVPQLSSSAAPVSRESVAEVIGCPANTVLTARLDGRIVGTLTLVVFPLPSGLRAWIEDVVVDASARGHGVGRALTRDALRRAAELGVRTVDLTSRPSRVAANRLYRTLGFEVRDSNVLRYAVDPAGEPPTPVGQVPGR